MYPRLCINLQKLHENGKKLCETAALAGINQLAFVTKVFCARPEMVSALEDLPNPYLADSRVENLRQYPLTKKEKILLRLPMLSQADEAVRWADISFCSESAVLASLEAAASHQNKIHKVVLMVDMGDLREGVFFREEKALLALAAQAEKAAHLDLFGMAFNLTCYGSVIPTQQTLEDFRGLVSLVEAQAGHKLPFVSAGNSSSLYLLGQADFSGFSNLRLGEGLVLGRETAYGKLLPGLHSDAVILEAEVVEVQKKPSYPVGLLGVNAFGRQVEYEDKGSQLRAIAAVGHQDIDAAGLMPLTAGMEVIGASSDHLILNVTHCSVAMGEVVRFQLDYAAALRAFTSPYVEKICR